jgi:hypothetical protein
MNRDQFKAICKKSQSELKQYVVTKLKKNYENLWIHKDFIFAKGDVPICLVAHLDTVHKELPKVFIEEADRISSPQGIGGDDRCGVYAILQIIKKHNCSVLFCCDEEVGGVGALVFSQSSLAKQCDFQYMIELDRKGSNDAVFYDCDNPKFTDFITEKNVWVENYGSYSDISEVAPAVGCAAVNLSVGYYNQHTVKEYVIPSEVDKCIDNVCKLIERTKPEDKFEYIEAIYDYKGYYGYRYSDYADYADYNYGYGYSFNKRSKYRYDEESIFLIQYQDELGVTCYDEVEASGEYEAIGKFMCEHQNIPFRNVFDVLDESYYASSQK